MIPEREQRIIGQRFAGELAGRVRLDYFTQKRSPLVVPGRKECQHCEDVGLALRDLARLHPRIALTVHELADEAEAAAKLGVKRVPCTVIRGQANRALRYYGLPGGPQFAVLIDAIVMSSKARVPVEEAAAATLRRLREPVQVSVFVTTACGYSAAVAHAAYRLALAQVHVKAEVVEVSEFPDLVERFAVTATPTTVLDGRLSVRGLLDDAQLAASVLQSAESPAVAPLVTVEAGASTPLPVSPAPDMPAAAAGAPRIYLPGQ